MVSQRRMLNIAQQLRRAGDKPRSALSKEEENSTNLSVGCLAALAVSMADAWSGRDYKLMQLLSKHIHQVDNLTRAELVLAYREGRLPDDGLMEEALNAMARHVVRRGRAPDG